MTSDWIRTETRFPDRPGTWWVEWRRQEEGGGRTPPKIAYDALGFQLDPVEAVRCRYLTPSRCRLTGPVTGPVDVIVKFRHDLQLPLWAQRGNFVDMMLELGLSRVLPTIEREPVQTLEVQVVAPGGASASFVTGYALRVPVDTSSIEALMATIKVAEIASAVVG